MFDLSGYSEYFTKSIKHSFAFENHEDGSTGNYRYSSAALAIAGCIFFFSAVFYVLYASVRACMKGMGKTNNKEDPIE